MLPLLDSLWQSHFPARQRSAERSSCKRDMAWRTGVISASRFLLHILSLDLHLGAHPSRILCAQCTGIFCRCGRRSFVDDVVKRGTSAREKPRGVRWNGVGQFFERTSLESATPIHLEHPVVLDFHDYN